MSDKVLLLDLHYTFAKNEDWHRGSSLTNRIPRETYHTWIIDLAKANKATVILTTARPEIHGDDTLDRILEVTGWEPDAAYFRMIDAQPHVAKEDNLNRIITEWGEPTEHWIAFESNERTRAMYKRRGIKAIAVHRTPPLTEWPYDGTLPTSAFALPG